jgi:hypothetical protein
MEKNSQNRGEILGLANKILVVIAVAIWIILVLFRFTPIAESIFSAITIFSLVVFAFFPLFRNISQHQGFNKPVATFFLLALCISGGVLLYFLPQQTVVAERVPLAIDARKDWQTTGISIEKGDIVTIQVTGGTWTSWRYALDKKYWSTLPQEEIEWISEIWVYRGPENQGNGVNLNCADVVTDDSLCPAAHYNESSLIARIESTIYGIGDSCSFVSEGTGELQLMMNDTALEDNAGVLAVQVTVGPRIANINSQPCGFPVD